MNNKRREHLSKVTEVFEKALDGALTYYSDKLTEIRDEEQDAYDNLPESIQESDKGQEIEDCLGAINEVLDELSVDDIIENLNIQTMLETCGAD